MRAYVADFETTTDPEDCRVWAFACCPVDDVDAVEYGNDMDGFMAWCEAHANCQLYFHNLAFDGHFLINHLERSGWEWVDDHQVRPCSYQYSTCVSDMNALYAVTLYFNAWFKVRIYDSLKIIPMSVKAMAKTFGLQEGKGEIDYEAPRAVGYVMTDEERDYIRRDVQIVALSLSTLLGNGMDKMTAGANALADFKRMMGGHKGFRRVFPFVGPEDDAFMRTGYKGGFTYCDPRWAGREVGPGIVLDVNSLYPSVMKGCDGQMLPFGHPAWFGGSPFDRAWKSKSPLWVASVTMSFKVKPDHIPCLQLKGNMRFVPTEYVRDSEGEVTVTVTNVDWELIEQQYDVEVQSWNGGFSFQGKVGLFADYVDKWTAVKVDAGKQGNFGMRTLAKLQLNSLYGKMATRTVARSRRPVLGDDGIILYVDLEEEVRDPVYLPAGMFITAWARRKTVEAAQKCYDRFLYADTDSLHLLGTDVPEFLDVDDYELGKWAHESTFSRGKFLRAKTYIEQEMGSDEITVHVAGMPANVHSQVTFENFELGATYDGKLYKRNVPGGVVLEPGPMTIRER